ncbi:MAG: aminotransferase class IV, partial [Candidatus Omnitrophica bacterium]|nr:aminotransferase class IV [Candidatus Omnitrophota bacterium]
IRCIISKKCIRNENSPVVYIKSLNYLENILARMEARKNKCDDAILLNTSGYLTSATVSNLFFVKKGRLYTPSLKCGVLKGTIRGLIFDTSKRNDIEIQEGRYTLDDLKDADEIFLTNTLMGVMPIKEIKGVFKSKNFTLSRFLKEEVDREITD